MFDCPDANHIERVWQDFHANVTRNHRCKTMKRLLDNAREYLDGYRWRRVTRIEQRIGGTRRLPQRRVIRAGVLGDLSQHQEAAVVQQRVGRIGSHVTSIIGLADQHLAGTHAVVPGRRVGRWQLDGHRLADAVGKAEVLAGDGTVRPAAHRFDGQHAQALARQLR